MHSGVSLGRRIALLAGAAKKPGLLGAPVALGQRLRRCGAFAARASRRAASARSAPVNSPAHLGSWIACSSVRSGRPRPASHGVTTSMW